MPFTSYLLTDKIQWLITTFLSYLSREEKSAILFQNEFFAIKLGSHVELYALFIDFPSLPFFVSCCVSSSLMPFYHSSFIPPFLSALKLLLHMQHIIMCLYHQQALLNHMNPIDSCCCHDNEDIITCHVLA